MIDVAHRHLLALSPPGGAFPREPASNWGRALRPLAEEHARLEQSAEALLVEVDPRAALPLLPDYERVLGEDPCLGPATDLPVELRRRVAHQRWTQRGGATPAFFVGLGAALGIEVEVIESQPWEVGLASVDDELIAESGRFEWFLFVRSRPLSSQAGLPLLLEDGRPLRQESATVLTNFEVGASDVDTPLEDFRRSPIECLARRHAPAHTALYFAYG